MFFRPPKSIENPLICLNNDNESIRNDQSSKSIKININKNLFNIHESPNSLNINFINNPEYIGCLNNNFASTNTNFEKSPIKNCDVSLNNIATNDYNIMKNANSSSLNNCNFQNQSENICVQKIKNGANPKSKFFKIENTKKFPIISNAVSTDELMTDINSSTEKDVMLSIDNDHSNELETSESSMDCIKNNTRQQSKNYNTSSSLKTRDDLIENDANILSNSFINDPKLSEKVIDSKNYSKPTKLNMATTEPYPKYTPTVEKAIKKYENKQPKKECIVM